MIGGLHITAVVPPPTTGMTLVTKRMSELFAAAGPTTLHPVQKPEGLTGWRWTLHKQRGIAKNLKAAIASKPDAIYYVPDAGKGLWANALLHAPLLGRAPRVILHHHVFSYIRQHDVKFAKFLSRVKAGGAQITHIALAPAMAVQLRTLYDADDVRVLGNTGFVDTSEIKPQPVERPLERVGFISNVTRDKGIDLFMETLRTLPKGTLAADIAGPIADAELRADIEAFVAEDPDNRRLLGPVYGAEKAAFFNGIQAFLFPSRYPNEAQPLSIYEALSAGLPVLATPQGAIADQLEGTRWVMDHDSFVAQASKRLAAWQADRSRFEKARTQAKALWGTAASTDEKALAALLADVQKPAATCSAEHLTPASANGT